MAGLWTDSFSFSGGVVQCKNIGYLVASDDEMDQDDVAHSIFIYWVNGEWHALEDSVLWICTSVCVLNGPVTEMIGLGMWGEILTLNQYGELRTELIGDTHATPNDRGPLRKVRAISETVFACGTDRQIYRRKAPNIWEFFGPDLECATDETYSFESLDGFSEADIYCVGVLGEIWHYNGSLWEKIDGLTNIIFNDLCCAPDGDVYICGRQGILLKGRNDRWDIIDHGVTDEDFWSICWFQGSIYLSTLKMIYSLDKNYLKPIDFGDDSPDTCYQLSSASDVLWSVGHKDVMAYDGRTWCRID